MGDPLNETGSKIRGVSFQEEREQKKPADDAAEIPISTVEKAKNIGNQVLRVFHKTTKSVVYRIQVFFHSIGASVEGPAKELGFRLSPSHFKVFGQVRKALSDVRHLKAMEPLSLKTFQDVSMAITKIPNEADKIKFLRLIEDQIEKRFARSRDPIAYKNELQLRDQLYLACVADYTEGKPIHPFQAKHSAFFAVLGNQKSKSYQEASTLFRVCIQTEEEAHLSNLPESGRKAQTLELIAYFLQVAAPKLSEEDKLQWTIGLAGFKEIMDQEIEMAGKEQDYYQEIEGTNSLPAKEAVEKLLRISQKLEESDLPLETKDRIKENIARETAVKQADLRTDTTVYSDFKSKCDECRQKINAAEIARDQWIAEPTNEEAQSDYQEAVKEANEFYTEIVNAKLPQMPVEEETLVNDLYGDVLHLWMRYEIDLNQGSLDDLYAQVIDSTEMRKTSKDELIALLNSKQPRGRMSETENTVREILLSPSEIEDQKKQRIFKKTIEELAVSQKNFLDQLIWFHVFFTDASNSKEFENSLKKMGRNPADYQKYLDLNLLQILSNAIPAVGKTYLAKMHADIKSAMKVAFDFEKDLERISQLEDQKEQMQEFIDLMNKRGQELKDSSLPLIKENAGLPILLEAAQDKLDKKMQGSSAMDPEYKLFDGQHFIFNNNVLTLSIVFQRALKFPLLYKELEKNRTFDLTDDEISKNEAVFSDLARELNENANVSAESAIKMRFERCKIIYHPLDFGKLKTTEKKRVREDIKELRKFVVNPINWDLIQQMDLSSDEWKSFFSKTVKLEFRKLKGMINKLNKNQLDENGQNEIIKKIDFYNKFDIFAEKRKGYGKVKRSVLPKVHRYVLKRAKEELESANPSYQTIEVLHYFINQRKSSKKEESVCDQLLNRILSKKLIDGTKEELEDVKKLISMGTAATLGLFLESATKYLANFPQSASQAIERIREWQTSWKNKSDEVDQKLNDWLNQTEEQLKLTKT